MPKTGLTCPNCHQPHIVLTHYHVHCEQCIFQRSFSCPLCQQPFDADAQTKPDALTCKVCRRDISLKKVIFLLESGWHVYHDQRCHICHAPVIGHPTIAQDRRCFFFPGCSGQQVLFRSQQAETVVFFDFETTGMEMGRHEIIEIGAVKIDPDGCEQTFQTFIKPQTALSEGITSFTGITNDDVAHAPAIGEALQSFAAFIGSSLLVAHHADFDVHWLLFEALMHTVSLNTQHVLCTLEWAKAQQESRCALGALAKKYGLYHEQAHRALSDAAATKALFFIFDKQAKGQRPIQPISTYEGLSQRLVKQKKGLR